VKDLMRETAGTMRGALRGAVPMEVIVESFGEAFPCDQIVKAFQEGLALFFSPFTGFWRVLSTVIRPPLSRRGEVHQYLGAE
jgi:hypothetical protein